jgi:protein-tyrosine phosphatase
MGIFNALFGKNKPKTLDFGSTLKVDMHSHLIPGIDDGVKTIDETIAMLWKFVDLGYKKVITTPHIMQEVYPNDKDNIYKGRDLVLKTIEDYEIPIDFEAAAEHFFDDHLMERVKRKDVLTFSGNHCLIEFGFHHEPTFEDNLFFDLLSAGYQPILAHFERYVYYHGSIEKALSFKEKGVLIQMNANSISGNYGPDVRKQALKLIENNAVDFIGSDAHRMQHLKMMEDNKTNAAWNKLNVDALKNRDL